MLFLLCFSKQHSLDHLFPLNVLLCTNFKYSPQCHLHLCRHLPLCVELQSHFDQHPGSKSTLHSLISTEESSQKLGVDGGTFLLLTSHFCNVSVLMKRQSVVWRCELYISGLTMRALFCNFIILNSSLDSELSPC